MSTQKPFNVLWLQSGGCGGCTLSMLGAEQPHFFELLRANGIRLLWHPALSEASGRTVLEILEACLSGETPLEVLCVEGAMLQGPNGTGRFHMMSGSGRPMIEWVRELAKVARYTVAVGSCAAYAGITATGGNAVEACGLQYDGDEMGGLLGDAYRSGAGLPVVNVSGCAVHPDWVLETLVQLVHDDFRIEEMDELGRPRFYADQLVHHGCLRNEYYEFKASAHEPSQLGCLMENMGCKGTQAHGDCNNRLWNGVGSCTRGGFACISCTEPGFEEPGHAFADTPKFAGIPIGLPTDMPKAWFVALASLSKSATPKRVKQNAVADHAVVPPSVRKTGLK